MSEVTKKLAIKNFKVQSIEFSHSLAVQSRQTTIKFKILQISNPTLGLKCVCIYYFSLKQRHLTSFYKQLTCDELLFRQTTNVFFLFFVGLYKQNVIPTNVIWTNVIWKSFIRANFIRTNIIRTNIIRTKVIRTNIIRKMSFGLSALFPVKSWKINKFTFKDKREKDC